MIKDGRQLIKKKGNFRKNLFEKITELEDTMGTVEQLQERQNDTVEDEGKNLRLTSDRTLRNAARYSLVQNFEETAQSGLSDGFEDQDDTRNFYFLRLWEGMNTFLPEEVQYSELKSNNLKVPFQRKKHRQFNRSFTINHLCVPILTHF